MYFSLEENLELKNNKHSKVSPKDDIITLIQSSKTQLETHKEKLFANSHFTDIIVLKLEITVKTSLTETIKQ